MKGSIGQKLLHIFVWIFLIGTSLFVLYPLVYVASAAFSDQQNIAALNIILLEMEFRLQISHIFLRKQIFQNGFKIR